MSTDSYFRRLDTARFDATENLSGAWSTSEQHIAPTIGLLTHLVEADRDARRGNDLRIARVSADILGVLTLDPVEVDVRVIRPGRTIELVEAELRQHGRAAVIFRAWLLQRTDTTELAGSTLDPLPAREGMTGADFAERWPGGYVKTVTAHKRAIAPGRAQCWIRPLLPLLDSEQTSPLARMLGILDIANGLQPRVDPRTVAFPNVDFTASFFRDPVGEWAGLDIRVSFGPDGTGLTATALHDEQGPVGTLAQTLTLRALG